MYNPYALYYHYFDFLDKLDVMQKDSLSFAEKHSGNFNKIKIFAMKAAKRVIHTLPLKRSLKKDLLESVALSAWLRMVSNTKRNHKTSRRLRRTLMNLY